MGKDPLVFLLLSKKGKKKKKKRTKEKLWQQSVKKEAKDGDGKAYLIENKGQMVHIGCKR